MGAERRGWAGGKLEEWIGRVGQTKKSLSTASWVLLSEDPLRVCILFVVSGMHRGSV